MKSLHVLWEWLTYITGTLLIRTVSKYRLKYMCQVWQIEMASSYPQGQTLSSHIQDTGTLINSNKYMGNFKCKILKYPRSRLSFRSISIYLFRSYLTWCSEMQYVSTVPARARMYRQTWLVNEYYQNRTHLPIRFLFTFIHSRNYRPLLWYFGVRSGILVNLINVIISDQRARLL